MQDRGDIDLTVGRGIAVREFPMKPGFGFADYLLYLDRKAIGAVEAKAEGTLTGVEAQSAKYAAGLPDNLPAHARPLPFLFESNGAVTYFTNGRDPVPRSRQVFNFPRPETLAEWIAEPAQLRGRLRDLPPLDETRLWKVQAAAIRNLDASFANADPRALIQMATGSGKTFTAVNVAYRLLKFARARRILFLVDRGNLGRQTEDEFANFEPPDDPRKFPTLYTVQRLRTNSINPAAKSHRQDQRRAQSDRVFRIQASPPGRACAQRAYPESKGTEPMKRKPAKGTSSVSKAKVYEAIGAYWDAHEVPPVDAKQKSVDFAVDIRRRQFLVAIEPKLFAKVRRRAVKQGVTAERLLKASS